MRVTRGPIAWLTALLHRLGVCGNAGVAVGTMTGTIITILDVFEGPLALSDAETVQLWLSMAVFGWLALLFIFTALVRWTARSVAVPALVNSALVTALTVLVVRVTGLFPLAWLIGILAGILVGFLLCSLYKRVARA